MRNVNSTLGYSYNDVARTCLFPWHKSHTTFRSAIGCCFRNSLDRLGSFRLLASPPPVQLTSWPQRHAFYLSIILPIVNSAIFLGGTVKKENLLHWEILLLLFKLISNDDREKIMICKSEKDFQNVFKSYSFDLFKQLSALTQIN